MTLVNTNKETIKTVDITTDKQSLTLLPRHTSQPPRQLLEFTNSSVQEIHLSEDINL